MYLCSSTFFNVCNFRCENHFVRTLLHTNQFYPVFVVCLKNKQWPQYAIVYVILVLWRFHVQNAKASSLFPPEEEWVFIGLVFSTKTSSFCDQRFITSSP